MTLPPEKLGDKGQRYVVKTSGWPTEQLSPVAYTDIREQALSMLRIISRRPSYTGGHVLDRETGDGIHLTDSDVSPT